MACLSRVVWLLVLAIASAGCSNRDLYESMRANQRFECQKLPPAEYDACMDEANRSFDDYRRERDELLEENE